VDKFVGTFTNKIDRKGRVSLPAEFRAVLQRQNSGSVALMPALNAEAVAGGGEQFLDALHARIAGLDQLSDEYNDWLDYVMPNVRQVNWDETGRLVLPERLISHAGLDEQAVFVGRYDHFQVWHPAAWDARQAEVSTRHRARRDRGGK